MTVWSDELTQAVLAEWKEGYSQGQIAKRYGLTRNQVAGKIHRTGARGIDREPRVRESSANSKRGGRRSRDWDEYLRESYSVFKVRKQMERANACR